MEAIRNIILELYKNDHITKEEVNILLDGLSVKNCCYNPSTYKPYIDWTYRPEEQPKWTITNNSNSTNVE